MVTNNISNYYFVNFTVIYLVLLCKKCWYLCVLLCNFFYGNLFYSVNFYNIFFYWVKTMVSLLSPLENFSLLSRYLYRHCRMLLIFNGVNLLNFPFFLWFSLSPIIPHSLLFSFTRPPKTKNHQLQLLCILQFIITLSSVLSSLFVYTLLFLIQRLSSLFIYCNIYFRFFSFNDTQ